MSNTNPQQQQPLNGARIDFNAATANKRRAYIEEFRDALSDGIPEEMRVVYSQSPEALGPGSRYAVKPLSDAKLAGLDPSENLYFCIGAVMQTPYEDTGNLGWRRTRKGIAAGLLVGLDDIGTKSNVGLEFFTSKLPPTVVTETSPGNFQVLYFLDKPILGEHEFGDVLRSIIEPLHKQYGIDKLADTTRVLRLPWGVNNKKYDDEKQPETFGKLKYPDEKGKPWRVRLELADYRCRYTPDQIAGAFGLKIIRTPKRAPIPKREPTPDDDYKAFAFRTFVDAAKKAGIAKRVSGDGGEKYRIQCPWGDEHASGRRSDSAFIADPVASDKGYYTFHCSSATCGAAKENGLRTFEAAMKKAGVEAAIVDQLEEANAADMPFEVIAAAQAKRDAVKADLLARLRAKKSAAEVAS